VARFRCPNCDYVYDEEAGEPREGWPEGTPLSAVDEDWPCPDCGVREAQDFQSVD
jgi:rubredoxin